MELPARSSMPPPLDGVADSALPLPADLMYTYVILMDEQLYKQRLTGICEISRGHDTKGEVTPFFTGIGT